MRTRTLTRQNLKTSAARAMFGCDRSILNKWKPNVLLKRRTPKARILRKGLELLSRRDNLGLARIDDCYSFDRSVAIPLARVIDRDKGRSIRNVENQTRRTAITAVLVAHSSERSMNSGIKKGRISC
jgi:hypothetical protein